jgi:3',5'-nucleoside bisphosphate phosphatase
MDSADPQADRDGARFLRADFHIHSCLSPCGGLDMSPSAIVRRAREVGLDAVGLTDHNCAFHVRVFDRLCRDAGLAPVCGIEVSTAEEVHVLALFDGPDAAEDLGRIAYASLPDIPNDGEVCGLQPIVNEKEEVLDFAAKALSFSTTIPIGRLVELVHERGGLCIPSHVERPYSGVIDRLGFIPDEPFDAVEVSRRTPPGERASLAGGFPYVSNSDAHTLEDVGAEWNLLRMDTFRLADVPTAIRRVDSK